MKNLAIFIGAVGGVALGFFTGNEAAYYRGPGVAAILTIIWMVISASEVALSFPGPRRWYRESLMGPLYTKTIRLIQLMERFARQVGEWTLARLPANSLAGKLIQLMLRFTAWMTQLEVRFLQRLHDYFSTEYYTSQAFMMVLLRVLVMSVGPGFLIGVLVY